jgi:hypothetical protein
LDQPAPIAPQVRGVSYLDPAGAATRAPLPPIPDLMGVVSTETLIDLMIAILTLGDRP